MTMTPFDARQRAALGGDVRHDEIEALAQRIYLDEGCPPNRALEHWLQAERMLLQSPHEVPLRSDELPRPA
ncbi:MAG: DUF2934 domain-containing protein [Verrucomicrobia bacterium]|nr:DUF2934 domain-containing protein [Verrucomicrobiota bacterium]